VDVVARSQSSLRARLDSCKRTNDSKDAGGGWLI